ncbi:hypothetical protein [Methanococcoides sp. AM1]|uniref:hypothetical protein n=1 Tax=Methanococcoides sp. AM1 TaxID=1201011 RepID=UPI001083B2C1|nr:hypothetical protein [Methanococcoides sp. AM1]
MGITYVSSGSEGHDNDGNAPIAYPASLQADDIIVALIYTGGAIGCTTPSDWTLAKEISTPPNLQLFWKRSTGSESGTQLFSGASNDQIMGAMSAFRGCITTGSPFDDGFTNSGTDDTMEVSLTTAPDVNDCMILACYGMDDDNTKQSMTGGWTEAYYYPTDYYTDSVISLQYKLQTTAQTESNVTLDVSASAPWEAIIIPLKPEPEVDKTVASIYDMLLDDDSSASYDILLDSDNVAAYDMLLNCTPAASYDILIDLNKAALYDILVDQTPQAVYDILINVGKIAAYDMLLNGKPSAVYDVLLNTDVEAVYDILTAVEKLVAAVYDILLDEDKAASYDMLVDAAGTEAIYDILLDGKPVASYDIILDAGKGAIYDILVDRTNQSVFDILLDGKPVALYDVSLDDVKSAVYDILLDQDSEGVYDVLLDSDKASVYDIHLDDSVQAIYDIRTKKIIRVILSTGDPSTILSLRDHISTLTTRELTTKMEEL